MKKRAEVKAFKAVNETTVEKQFLMEPVFTDGWYPTVEQALEAFSRAMEAVSEPEQARKPGRPKKA